MNHKLITSLSDVISLLCAVWEHDESCTTWHFILSFLLVVAVFTAFFPSFCPELVYSLLIFYVNYFIIHVFCSFWLAYCKNILMTCTKVNTDCSCTSVETSLLYH